MQIREPLVIGINRFPCRSELRSALSSILDSMLIKYEPQRASSLRAVAAAEFHHDDQSPARALHASRTGQAPNLRSINQRLA
jgi:hypothetical protein